MCACVHACVCACVCVCGCACHSCVCINESVYECYTLGWMCARAFTRACTLVTATKLLVEPKFRPPQRESFKRP